MDPSCLQSRALAIILAMIRMAVFLGNTGRGYASTRHNAGFMLADHLFPSASYSVKFHSAYAKEGGLVILKPLTQMNLSGTAVSEAATFFKIPSEEILVVHDDLEIPLGKAVWRLGGGLQGHNGLRSIKERIGTAAFWRLRIGIGRPVHGDVANYVLSPFSEEEKAVLEALFHLVKEEWTTRPIDGKEIRTSR